MMRPVILGYDGSKPVTLSATELSTHLMVYGASGRGKTVFLQNLAQQLMARNGLLLLDPHGGLADGVVAWLAMHPLQGRRVHLIEPRNLRTIVGFNPLRFDPDHLTAGIDSVVAAFGSVWTEGDLNERPRLMRSLRAMLFMLAENQLPLADAVPLFAPQSKATRTRLAQQLTHPYFKSEWQDFIAMRDSERREYFEAASNRLSPLISSNALRAMLGQTDRVLDFNTIMDAGDVVIVNLARSPAFTSNDARMLGALLLNDVAQKALLRKLPNPRPFFVMADEFSQFVSADIEVFADQTRKFGVHLIAAMQRTAQSDKHGEAIASGLRSIQSRVCFGGMASNDCLLMAEDMYIGALDPQKVKKKITTPVTVGHELTWLDSESDSEGDAWLASDTEGESAGDSITRQWNGEDAEFSPTEQVGSSRSGNRARSTAHTGSRSHARGRHEALRPILEERATQTYSLQEQLYEKSALLRHLPVGHAVAKIHDRPAQAFSVPLHRVTLPNSVLAIHRAELAARTPSAQLTQRALATVDARQRALLTHTGDPRQMDAEDADVEIELVPRGMVKGHGQRKR